jgi:aminodeoxyfutalosine synthase
VSGERNKRVGEGSELAARSESGERLSREDAARLWQLRDLTALGAAADRRRESRSGRVSHYRLSLHAGTERLPATACPYCSLYGDRLPRDETSLEALLGPLDPAIAGELHLGGQPAHGFDLQAACNLVRRARLLRPGLRVCAFTWKDVQGWSRAENRAASRVLRALVDCGLAAMAGEAVATTRPGADPGLGLSPEELRMWLAAAAEAGLRSELTWFVGTEEDAEPVADLLIRLREGQDRYGVLDCLTPFPRPKVGERGELLESTGYQWMRSIAVARIVLDNIPHVRVCAGVTADALVQLAQWYGADDAGTAPLTSDAATGGIVAEERLRRLLLEAGVQPVNVYSLAP